MSGYDQNAFAGVEEVERLSGSLRELGQQGSSEFRVVVETQVGEAKPSIGKGNGQVVRGDGLETRLSGCSGLRGGLGSVNPDAPACEPEVGSRIRPGEAADPAVEALRRVLVPADQPILGAAAQTERQSTQRTLWHFLPGDAGPMLEPESRRSS